MLVDGVEAEFEAGAWHGVCAKIGSAEAAAAQLDGAGGGATGAVVENRMLPVKTSCREGGEDLQGGQFFGVVEVWVPVAGFKICPQTRW